MEEGLLSLKWNNHKSTFFQVLSVLREKHTYTDVTLACDGHFYQAHKFVLSTCSEYFSDIFTSTNGTSLVIVLKDVRRQDLEYLMDYMYLGQVDVAQSELPSLIKTAECLRIKGLAIPDDEPHKTQRRCADEREGSPPPSKKKRHLQEDDRHPASSSSISTSTTNINNNATITSSSSSSTSTSGRLQMEVLPPPSDIGPLVQHLRQVPISQQPLQAPLPPPPTSHGISKSHSSQPLSLNLTTHASRTSQGGSSGLHPLTPTSTAAQSSHQPLCSPSHTTPIPVIKEEAADPPETPEGYLNESFEENETKPDVSDPRHLDPDGAVPGPSGLQGSADNWEGDGEMSGYGGGDGYPEGSLEEQGESEVQGGRIRVKSRRELGLLSIASSTSSLTLPSIVSCSSPLAGKIRTSPSPSTPQCLTPIMSPLPTSPAPFMPLSPVITTVTSPLVTMAIAYPLKCPYCNYVGTSESVLLRHLRTHSGGLSGVQLYHCNACPYSATQWESVRRHSWRQHRQEIEPEKDNR